MEVLPVLLLLACAGGGCLIMDELGFIEMRRSDSFIDEILVLD